MSAKTSARSRTTVAIITHGCKLNQADSSLLAQQFVAAGFQLVATDAPADVYIVNTCTVTHVADRKARHALKALRRQNPEATVVATGCYPQRAPEELRALEEIDLVIGNTGKASLVQQVMDWRLDGREETLVPGAIGAVRLRRMSPGNSRTRANVKIQEGCNQVCSYCIVPKVRGRERSIPPDEILGEINRHVAGGCKEVVLTGTQLGSYGFDLLHADLVRLLARILAETSLQRLRISSLQPQEIGADLLKLWSDARLCPHFHLPLQSGSNSVLKRMRRRYTASHYLQAVERVRKSVPNVSITADVIAGFPGETEKEFQETYDLCARVGFAGLHVFPYSVRPGTGAAHMDEKVAREVKQRRVQALLSLAEASARQFRSKSIGEVRPVLWEGTRLPSGNPVIWSGLTDNYIRVQCRSRLPLGNAVTPARLCLGPRELLYAQLL